MKELADLFELEVEVELFVFVILSGSLETHTWLLVEGSLKKISLEVEQGIWVLRLVQGGLGIDNLL